MTMSVKAVALTISLFFGMTLGAQTNKEESTFVRADSVNVRSAQLENVPVEIRDGVLESDYGINSSRLTFSVANKSTQPLEQVKVGAFFVQNDIIVGGQISCAKAPLKANETRKFSVPVAGTFSEPTTVILIVQHAATATKLFNVSGKSIRKTLETSGASLRFAAEESKFHKNLAVAPDYLCDPTFCSECKDMAVEVCGSRGVSQFTCGLSNCTCSFTCSK